MSILGDQIREWDDTAEEEEGEFGERLKPFDGGIMLAVATLFDAWDDQELSYLQRVNGRVVSAVEGLRETVKAVIA